MQLSALQAPADALGLARTLVGGNPDDAFLAAVASVVDQAIENEVVIRSAPEIELTSDPAEEAVRILSDVGEDHTIWSRLEAALGTPLRAVGQARFTLFLAGMRTAAAARLTVEPLYHAELIGSCASLRKPVIIVAEAPGSAPDPVPVLCRAMVTAGLPDGGIAFHGGDGQVRLRLSSVHRYVAHHGLAVDCPEASAFETDSPQN